MLNGRTFSSRTGKTSGLPKIKLSRWTVIFPPLIKTGASAAGSVPFLPRLSREAGQKVECHPPEGF